MAYRLKKQFVPYYIKQLLNSDFGKKPQIFITKPSLVQAPFASSSPTLGSSVPAPANTLIYCIQPLEIILTPITYNIPVLYILGSESIL